MSKNAFVATPGRKAWCAVSDCRREIPKGTHALAVHSHGIRVYICGGCCHDFAVRIDFLNSPEAEERSGLIDMTVDGRSWNR